MAYLICCSRSTCFIAKSGIFRHTAFSKSRTAAYLSTNSVPSTQLPPPLHNWLLYGISDISSAGYYSSKLPLQQAVELVKNNRVLYDIVSQECECDQGKIDKYLENIFVRMNSFMKKNKVWDRAELMNGLNGATEIDGNFVCLLGGKSTGKSLVLKEFAREEKSNNNVIYIDMRSGYPSIVYGFTSVIKKSSNASLQKLAFTVLKTIFSTKAKLKDIFPNTSEIALDFNPLLDLIKEESDPNMVLESLLTGMAGKAKMITLVIDEANLPLTIDSDTSETKIEQVKTTLALFTRLTKQERKVSYQFFILLLLL